MLALCHRFDEAVYAGVRKSSATWAAERGAETLSRMTMDDLQKMHFAPKGLASLTSKCEVLYCDP